MSPTNTISQPDAVTRARVCSCLRCDEPAAQAVTFAYSSPIDPTPLTRAYCARHAGQKVTTPGATSVPLPACPSWCQGEHAPVAEGDDVPTVGHRHQTSGAEEPYLVSVEQYAPLTGQQRPAGVYVQDPHGDDLTAAQARAMAAALVEAACIADDANGVER